MTIPPIPAGASGNDLISALNNRFQLLQAALTKVQNMINVQLTQVVLVAKDPLAVGSSAAPLESLPVGGTPSAIVALMKVGPTSTGLTFQVLAGATVIGTGTVAAGNTTVTVTSGLQPIPANAVITLAITAAPAVPGNGLSVMVRF
jgi:hypothetical protein